MILLFRLIIYFNKRLRSGSVRHISGVKSSVMTQMILGLLKKKKERKPHEIW